MKATHLHLAHGAWTIEPYGTTVTVKPPAPSPWRSMTPNEARQLALLLEVAADVAEAAESVAS